MVRVVAEEATVEREMLHSSGFRVATEIVKQQQSSCFYLPDDVFQSLFW